MAEYYNVTTNQGDAEIANAITNNAKIEITHIAFGDGAGSVPTPSKIRTTLVREVHRQAVTKYERHPANPNWIVIETIIPSDIGGFTIREMGIIGNGKLISHGSHAPFEKVADPSGVSEYRLKFTQNITDGNVVSITLDDSLIYATQAWVEENFIKRSEIVDNLTTNDSAKPVSAKQAKILQETKFKSNGSMPVSSDFPAWDSVSGVYTKANENGQQIVLQFLGTGSVPSVQFLVDYSNGGISYRSARDTVGFEKPFEKLVTEVSGTAPKALRLANPVNITLTGAAQGSASFDGLNNISIYTAGLAAGQAWQIPIRSGDITYTNSTGKPIYVLAYVRITSTVNAIDIWCGGVKIFTARGVAVNQVITCSFPVPNGNTYALTLNSHELISWSELR